MILNNKSLRTLFFCLMISLMVSCKSGDGGGGGESTDTSPGDPIPPVEIPTEANIAFKRFNVTPQAPGSDVTLNLEITTEDNSVVFYQITDHENAKFKPNSGIIVPKQKKGTLITTLTTDQPGTYDFQVTLTNNKNQKAIRSFTTTISD